MTNVDNYISIHSTANDEVLEWITRQTNLRTNHARMLSGNVQGKLLEFFSRMVAPQRILEIGTFTGYSAICLARGLRDGGAMETLELNDELEDIIREGFERAGLSQQIDLIFGDAKESIKRLNYMYDIVFIDANKREYCEYYDLIFDKVRSGGYILADNVLWDGKVALENPPKDAQTTELIRFNELIKNDRRVENVIIPLRDGLNVIRKK